MTIGEAVRQRILNLCKERDVTLNALSVPVRDHPIHPQQYRQRAEQQHHRIHHPENLRWTGDHYYPVLYRSAV